MIMSRLVWMQLRSYDLIPDTKTLDAFLSLSTEEQQRCGGVDLFQKLALPYHITEPNSQTPESGLTPLRLYRHGLRFLCDSSSPYQQFINWQWLMIIATILASVFTSRILSGSWLLPALIAATLLSRGTFLAQIGSVSFELTLTCLFNVLLCCLIHFLRTGSHFSVIIGSMILITASGLSEIFLILSFTLPVALPFFPKILQTDHKETPTPVQRKSILLPVNRPARNWIPDHYNRSSFLNWWLLTCVFSSLFWMLCQISTHPAFPLGASSAPDESPLLSSVALLSQQDSFMPLDIHYGLSLFCILLFRLRASRKNQWALHEAVQTFLILTAQMILLSLFSDLSFVNSPYTQTAIQESFSIQHIFPAAVRFANWLEPVILSLGIVCFFHILKEGPKDLIILKKPETTDQSRTGESCETIP